MSLPGRAAQGTSHWVVKLEKCLPPFPRRHQTHLVLLLQRDTGLAEQKLSRASTQDSQERCWPWISYHTRPPWAAPSAPQGSHHTMGRKQTVTRGRAVAPLQQCGTQQGRMLLLPPALIPHIPQAAEPPKSLLFNSRNSAEL